MTRFRGVVKTSAIIATSLMLCSCALSPDLGPPLASSQAVVALASRVADDVMLPPVIIQNKSRWTPVRWTELPGWEEDQLPEAWNAWLKNCEKPRANFVLLCNEVRPLSIATTEAQRAWMLAKLQPYRVESLQGAAEGLLTSYYEPLLQASRQPSAAYFVPLYRPPLGFGSRKPWYSRQEIETLPQARAALQGREIAWLTDPVDAMLLHIQGSGRLSIIEADGTQRVARLAFAGTNDHPFRSVTQWLAEHGAGKMAPPWTESLKVWASKNPQLVQEMLWSNPRYVFFKEEAVTEVDAFWGPRGAQGVALTPGRSIAVDPSSIPYGTPVWLASRGTAVDLQRLVFAQDTGNAIMGAVRADYFAGTGPEAGDLAFRIHQPLRLWVLWPR